MATPTAARTARTRRAALALTAGACAAAAIRPLRAQPSPPHDGGGVAAPRPARMLCPGTAGSGVDLAARVLADGLARRRGHPIALDNRPGADGTLAAGAFAQARPGEALF